MTLRHGFLLLLAATAASGSAGAAGTTLTATPAWEGWSRPGRLSELELRIGGAGEQVYSVEIEAGSQRIATSLSAAAGRDSLLRLPVPAHETISVRASAAGIEPADVLVPLSQAESPLLAWAAAPPSADPAGLHLLPVGAGAFPRQAAAYSSIDALVVDAATLGSLDEAQLAALIAHASGCGPVVLVGVRADVADMLRHAAACQGRRLAVVPTPAQASAALERILAADNGVLQPIEGLRALGDPQPGVWNTIALLAGLYVAVAVVLSALTASFPLLIGAPAVVTALFAALGALSEPADRLLVWSEAHSGDPAAVYAARQLATGTGRGAASLRLAELLASPQRCRAERALHWNFDSDRGRFDRVSYRQRLFERTTVCYRGHFPITRAGRLEHATEGPPTVRNTGPGPWPAGWVSSGGRLYPVPGLGAGRSASLSPDDGARPRDAARRAALRRTPAVGSAMLWPLDLGTISEQLDATEGWLLLQLPGEERT